MVHSSWVVKSGRFSVYVGLWSHLRVNARNRYARSCNSSVDFQWGFTFTIGSTAMRTVAFRHSLNSFRQPGVSVINTTSILCYMKLSFSTCKISWNTYLLNYLCETWTHGRHPIDSRIAHFPKCLTLPKAYAFILSKVLIAHMGFPRVGPAFYTQTADECTSSQLYDVRHARNVVPQCRPLDSRGLKCWLQVARGRVIGGGIISRNSKQTSIGMLNTIEHVI